MVLKSAKRGRGRGAAGGFQFLCNNFFFTSSALEHEILKPELCSFLSFCNNVRIVTFSNCSWKAFSKPSYQNSCLNTSLIITYALPSLCRFMIIPTRFDHFCNFCGGKALLIAPSVCAAAPYLINREGASIGKGYFTKNRWERDFYLNKREGGV